MFNPPPPPSTGKREIKCMPKNSCGYREKSTSTEYNIYERIHGDQEMIMQALNIEERAVTNCTMQVNSMAHNLQTSTSIYRTP